MRKGRKLASAILAIIMLFAMSITTFAANITVSGDTGNYEGYRLLNATSDSTDTNWAYTVNTKYSTILKTAAGNEDMTDDALITAIEGYDAATLRSFADKVYTAIKAANMTPDATATNNTFAGVDSGYWLIADVTDNTGTNVANSLVMVDNAGNTDVTVDPKKSTPTVEKKVYEDSNTTWQDGADYDIGDVVPFKLTGTLPSNYDSYTTYKYTFHDTLSAGLTFDPNSVKVEINGEDVTGHFEVNTGLTDGCSFEVTCANLKAITGVTITSASEIVVTYTARLNEHAFIAGAGNPNEVYLEYSNNPYETTDTGKTPEDKVVVFTFELDVNKVDGNKNPLAGATFTLYKWNYSTLAWDVVKKIVGTDATEFVFSGLDSGIYKLEETQAPAGYNPIEDITFTIASTYDHLSTDPKLEKIEIYDASNNIISTMDPNETAQFHVTLNPTAGNGNIVTTIENRSGSELPSTGGIGTTIFTMAGLILMAGAVVLMVLKRGRRANSK